jgi:hypothetical protein
MLYPINKNKIAKVAERKEPLASFFLFFWGDSPYNMRFQPYYCTFNKSGILKNRKITYKEEKHG